MLQGLPTDDDDEHRTESKSMLTHVRASLLTRPSRANTKALGLLAFPLEAESRRDMRTHKTAESRESMKIFPNERLLRIAFITAEVQKKFHSSSTGRRGAIDPRKSWAPRIALLRLRRGKCVGRVTGLSVTQPCTFWEVQRMNWELLLSTRRFLRMASWRCCRTRMADALNAKFGGKRRRSGLRLE